MIPEMVRKTIEDTYTDCCTVINKVKIKKKGVVSFEEETVLKRQPCRLSYASSSVLTEKNGASAVTQSIRLFLAPECDIKPGAKILIEREGRVETYQRTGTPAVYPTHQEIELERYEEYA